MVNIPTALTIIIIRMLTNGFSMVGRERSLKLQKKLEIVSIHYKWLYISQLLSI